MVDPKTDETLLEMGGFDAIEEAMRAAREDAVRFHRVHNIPIVGWRDGKVTHTPPDALPAHDDKVDESAE